MKDSIETRLLKMNKKKYGNSSGKKAAESMVGSIAAESKRAIIGAEFDLLYGVSDANTSSVKEEKDVAMEEVYSALI